MHTLFKVLLQQYNIDTTLIEPLKFQLEKTFFDLKEDNRTNEKHLKSQLTEISKKIDTIQERFVLGEIERELYDKFMCRYREEKQQISIQLENSDMSFSNLTEYAELSLTTASNLLKMWDLGSYTVKENLQYMVFPEGILYDRQNDLFRTKRVNAVLQLIACLSSSSAINKKGQNSNKTALSNWAPPPGLEPGTY